MGIFNKFKTSKDTNDESNAQPVVSPKVVSKAPVTKAKKPVEKVEKSAAKEEKSKDRKAVWENRDLHGVLLRPLITEKATNLTGVGQYVFSVSKSANKIQIAQAIEVRYGIKPLKINIINNKGRKVRYGRTLGQTKDWKKAVIILPEGKTIEIQEGV